MSQASSSPIRVGGIVGGVVIAVLLVGVVIVIICVLITIGRHRLRKEYGTKEHEGNATYDRGI